MKNRGWKMINDVNRKKKKRNTRIKVFKFCFAILLMCVSKKQEILKNYK